MPDILHRFTIDAPVERVHDLIAIKEGVEQWWTGHPNGASDNTLEVYFGGDKPAAVMKVIEDTLERIVWRVIDGPADWVDTTVTFALQTRAEGASRCCSRTATGAKPMSSCTAAAPTGALTWQASRPAPSAELSPPSRPER